MTITTQGAWGTLCVRAFPPSLLVKFLHSHWAGDKTEQKREYLEVVIATKKSETEINSAKRGKNRLAFEEDIEFKKFLS